MLVNGCLLLFVFGYFSSRYGALPWSLHAANMRLLFRLIQKTASMWLSVGLNGRRRSLTLRMLKPLHSPQMKVGINVVHFVVWFVCWHTRSKSGVYNKGNIRIIRTLGQIIKYFLYALFSWLLLLFFDRQALFSWLWHLIVRSPTSISQTNVKRDGLIHSLHSFSTGCLKRFLFLTVWIKMPTA